MAEENTSMIGEQSSELESLKLKLSEVLQSISTLQSEEGKLQALNLLKTATSEAQLTVQATPSTENDGGNIRSSPTGVAATGLSSETTTATIADDVSGIAVDVNKHKSQKVAPQKRTKPKRKLGCPRKAGAKKSIVTGASTTLPVKPYIRPKRTIKRKLRLIETVHTRRKRKLEKTPRVIETEQLNIIVYEPDDGTGEKNEEIGTEKEAWEEDEEIKSENDAGDKDEDDSDYVVTQRSTRNWRKRIHDTHKCNMCEMTFSHGKTFKAHVRTHDKAACCCLKCREKFYNYAEFGHHECRALIKALKPRKVRECRVCQKQFTNVKLYESHLIKEHKEHPEPRYACTFCSRRFARKNSLRVHLRLHAQENSQVACMVCGDFFENIEALTAHEQGHRANAEATCDTCGVFFMRSQQYDQHVKAHKKYDCKACGRPFFQKKASLQHQKTVHNVNVAVHKEYKYECPTCGKKMQRPGMLEMHMRLHTGEKPIECKLCHLFFRTPKAYTKHTLTNTHMKRSGEIPKERVFMCEICGSSYYRKQALQRHLNASHFKDKIYKCPHCDFACTEHSNLRVHVNLHFDSARNFICELCGCAFHTKKTLHEHTIYKHSEERNFVCDVCSMSFKTKNALVRHCKTHETEKPYVCICGTAFRRSYNLRRHTLKIHGTDSNLPPVRRVKVLDVDPNSVQGRNTTAQRKRAAKPKQPSQIANLLTIPGQQEVSVVTLQAPVIDHNLVQKSTDTFDDPRHMPTSFLEQLASAVEYGREEVVAGQATGQVIETTDNPDMSVGKTTMDRLSPVTLRQFPKGALGYKWHQLTPQNIRQLASAVEYGREEVVTAQATEQVIETTDNPDTSVAQTTMDRMSPVTVRQDPKSTFGGYKWHQIAPQNIRLQQYATDTSYPLSLHTFYPTTADNVRFTTPVTDSDTATREQYQQEMYPIVQFQTLNHHPHHQQ